MICLHEVNNANTILIKLQAKRMHTTLLHTYEINQNDECEASGTGLARISLVLRLNLASLVPIAADALH